MRSPLRRLATADAQYLWVHRQRPWPAPNSPANAEPQLTRQVQHRVSIWRDQPTRRGRSAALQFVVQAPPDARLGSPLNVGLQATDQPAPNLNRPATIRALIAWAEAQHWQGHAPLAWHGDLGQLMDLLAVVTSAHK